MITLAALPGIGPTATIAMLLPLTLKMDPNVKAPDGSTPLHQAVQAQKIDLIRALAEAGGKLDAVDKDNLTPLLLAESMVKKAAEAKAPVDTAAPVVNRAQRDSLEDVVATLRELMHLGPNDPAPQPPPPPKKDESKGGEGKGKESAPDAP